MRKYIFGLAILIVVVYSCANPGYPSGGPKDEDPPKVEKSVPKNGAMNFKKDEVIIEFDEIITLNEVSQKLVISPPMKEKPKVDARAQKLYIKFEEKLQENTTYTLDFADAIADNNEGNTIKSFVFSFSTGEVVDSFAIMGNLWESFDLSPISDAYVMVHKNLNDTAFTHDVPVRIGKSNEDGFFAIRNLSPGEYRVYAIEDANRNYMFDQPGERIAWFDTIVSPSMEYVSMPDTLANDSVIFKDELVYAPNKLKLFMFEEESVQQYFIGEERSDSNKISFVFNLPVEKFEVKPIGIDYKNDWAIYEPSVANDTINVWLTDSAMYKSDTLNFALSYMGLDTLMKPAQVLDTLKTYYFTMPKKKEKKRKRKDDSVVKVNTLMVDKSTSSVDLNKKFNFIMPTPIKKMNRAGLSLFEQVDTLMNKVDFSISQDSLLKRKYSISTKGRWTPGAKYLFVADSLAIEDVYGLRCDSIGKQFSIKTVDSYATMLVNMANPEDDWLVQLLSGSGNLVAQKLVPASGKFGFQFLKPGTYELKLVIDKNKNEQWDTGEYATKKQAEQVYFYPGKVELRANWDSVVKWDVKAFDIYDFISKNRTAKKDKN